MVDLLNSAAKMSFRTYLICLLIFLLSLSIGCGKSEQVNITGFEVKRVSGEEAPLPIPPNTRVLVLGKVNKSPGNLPVSYKWECSGGRLLSISEKEPSAFYESPSLEGLQKITIIANIGERELARKTLPLDVKSEENLSATVPSQGIPVKPSEPVSTKSSPAKQGDVGIDNPKDGIGVDQRITVSGKVRKLSGSEYLTILVRPIPTDPNQSWWVQSFPKIESDGSWTSSDVYIGLPDDRPGLPFRICAVIMTTKNYRGDNLRELPSRPRACVNVRRK